MVRPASPAVSVLRPFFRPVTRPSKCPLGRAANARVTSRPSRRTVAGPETRTSASPPETRSARLDSTVMRDAPAAAGADSTATSANNKPLRNIGKPPAGQCATKWGAGKGLPACRHPLRGGLRRQLVLDRPEQAIAVIGDDPGRLLGQAR